MDIPTLQYLYLQNNQITEIPELSLPSLKKLYLDENEISFVSGLEKCAKLEELHIARQRLVAPMSLLFEIESLNAISRSLEVLEVSGNGISVLGPFTVLYNLRKFFCEHNAVDDITEVEAVVSLPNMEEASFIGNPCCLVRTYRDYAIGSSADSLTTLDKIPVLRHQQVAIRGYTEKRKRLGVQQY
jgi:protein phosphatase 1 regulatory subunit 42